MFHHWHTWALRRHEKSLPYITSLLLLQILFPAYTPSKVWMIKEEGGNPPLHFLTLLPTFVQLPYESSLVPPVVWGGVGMGETQGEKKYITAVTIPTMQSCMPRLQLTASAAGLLLWWEGRRDRRVTVKYSSLFHFLPPSNLPLTAAQGPRLRSAHFSSLFALA